MRLECALTPTAGTPCTVHCAALASTVVILYQADGHKRVAHLLSDSSFSFSDVPSGSHLLHAFHVNAYFPEVGACHAPSACCVAHEHVGQPQAAAHQHAVSDAPERPAAPARPMR